MNLYEQIGEEKIDELVMHMYDDIIPNDDRINLLFNDGFDKIKIEQKRFFRLFLGQPGHSIFATPDLRKKHMKLPISIKEAKYWLEDFELALDRIDIDPAIKSLTTEVSSEGFIYATTSSSSDLENISLSVSGEAVETNLIEDFIL